MPVKREPGNSNHVPVDTGGADTSENRFWQGSWLPPVISPPVVYMGNIGDGEKGIQGVIANKVIFLNNVARWGIKKSNTKIAIVFYAVFIDAVIESIAGFDTLKVISRDDISCHSGMGWPKADTQAISPPVLYVVMKDYIMGWLI